MVGGRTLDGGLRGLAPRRTWRWRSRRLTLSILANATELFRLMLLAFLSLASIWETIFSMSPGAALLPPMAASSTAFLPAFLSVFSASFLASAAPHHRARATGASDR